jgi:hypothetical protein
MAERRGAHGREAVRPAGTASPSSGSVRPLPTGQLPADVVAVASTRGLLDFQEQSGLSFNPLSFSTSCSTFNRAGFRPAGPIRDVVGQGNRVEHEFLAGNLGYIDRYSRTGGKDRHKAEEQTGYNGRYVCHDRYFRQTLLRTTLKHGARFHPAAARSQHYPRPSLLGADGRQYSITGYG